MQAEPFLTVTGTVVGSRRVDVPARESETRSRAGGDSYTTRATDAWSYLEVGIQTDAVINGEKIAGLTGIITVRLEVADELPDTGARVSYGVIGSVAKSFIRGAFREWVIYKRAVDLTPELPAAVPAPRESVAA